MSGALTRALTRAQATWAVVLLGGAALATAAPVWVRSQVATALDPHVAVTVTGTDAAPAIGAGALVLVAAGLALALGGRVARWVVLVVAAGAGVLVTASALTVATDPRPAAVAGASETAGVTDLTAPVSLAVWPWLTAAVGVLAVVVALLAAVASRGWSATSGRHERAGATAGAPAGAAAGSAPTGADAAEPAAADGEPGDEGDVDAHDAWDALTRGTDPTADR
ncbi:Trp biosynthesis-associated membrane protein [Puerhibacterium puerhi]|uniref:Trp biosynthesis-associated membrane protein n=1 Tax=Puerhibacterium puerhi TaxID=2692623 RepID=UPI0013581CCF|nr:Trp biosynthesis-associated membrane protein [Puerhibacterium puerhi]